MLSQELESFPKIHYLYEIYCTELKENYYGKTDDFRRRYSEHKVAIRHGTVSMPIIKFVHANMKYDWRMHLIAIADMSMIDIVEHHYIPHGSQNSAAAGRENTTIIEPVISQDDQKQYRCIPYYCKDKPNPQHEASLTYCCDNLTLTGLTDVNVINNKPIKTFPIQVQYRPDVGISVANQPLSDIKYIYKLKNFKGDKIYYGYAADALTTFRTTRRRTHGTHSDDTDLSYELNNKTNMCWSYEIVALADTDLVKHILSCFIQLDSTINNKSHASAKHINCVATQPKFSQEQRDTYMSCIPYFYAGRCSEHLPTLYYFPWVAKTAFTQDLSEIKTDGLPKRNGLFLVQPLSAIVYDPEMKPTTVAIKYDNLFIVPSVDERSYDMDAAERQQQLGTKRVDIRTGQTITPVQSTPTSTPMPRKRRVGRPGKNETLSQITFPKLVPQ